MENESISKEALEKAGHAVSKQNTVKAFIDKMLSATKLQEPPASRSISY